MNGLARLGFQVEHRRLRACSPNLFAGAFTSDQVRVQRSRVSALHSTRPDGTGTYRESQPARRPVTPMSQSSRFCAERSPGFFARGLDRT